MRYHLTAVRMANIKKSATDKCWEGCGEKESLLHRWWECKLVQPLWRTVGRFLRKLKTELPYDPAIPLLGIYPDKSPIKKDTHALRSCALCCAFITQSCPTLCDPVDCSPPGSSVHGILQARILEWVAVPSSRGSSQPRNQTCFAYISCIGRRVLYH